MGVSLKLRVTLIQLGCGLFFTALSAGTLGVLSRNREFSDLHDRAAAELFHISGKVGALIEETMRDIDLLSSVPAVLDRDDAGFTSFIGADERTFSYRQGPAELGIVALFAAYRASHPGVSAVYMGRENGTFVRSHPRTSPTDYDPRLRPWYMAALASPDRTVVTEPYASVTNDDINIGVVRALTDGTGAPFGVLGIDLTLSSLSSYLAGSVSLDDSSLLLVDGTGKVLANSDGTYLFRPLDESGLPFSAVANAFGLGYFSAPYRGTRSVVFVHPVSVAGWYSVLRVAERSVMARVIKTALEVILISSGAIALLVLVNAAALGALVLRPVASLEREVARIAGAADWKLRVPGVAGTPELESLSRAFNKALDAVEEYSDGRDRALQELELSHQGLERKVAERTASLLEAKERAEQADRVKSAFMATMSHELRTPLNSILGFTGIIAQKLAGPLNAEQEKQIGMVQGSARHLLSLINDVLDISKIEAGQLNVSIERVDCAESVLQAMDLVRPAAEAKGLSLTGELPDGLPHALADRRRLGQILLNLLSNAVKFTEHGVVRVSARASGGAVLIEVADTGIGIREADREKLFKPFSQVDDGTARKYEGTGLGLSICKRLAELMGGGIELDSRFGKGTAVTVRFPATDGGQP